jgi:hypothetical protein
MSKMIVCCLFLVACAAESSAIHAPTAAVRSDAAFPSRVSAADLPSVRAIASRINATGPLSAGLDVCVAPSGDTASVDLRRSSGERQFDNALIADVAAWRYEAAAMVHAHQRCEQTTVTFVP